MPKDLSRRIPQKIAVVFISREESRRLNFIYRLRSKPTNVLTFGYGKDYGEILICQKIVRSEAEKHGNSHIFQMTWMILHGMIHLAGIHHEASVKARTLAGRIENRILESIFKKRGRNSKRKA